eukprot:TRINITY_DN11333_c0_g2_i2.p1 TRINITY_DN11333_c0_g2~~TRINITY_DN11333_c0_g2_i2.p1  ORF type:complete len:364 (-),score=45.85 TRINITY_DN11333_c0_g2_i2:20-1057(-)
MASLGSPAGTPVCAAGSLRRLSSARDGRLCLQAATAEGESTLVCMHRSVAPLTLSPRRLLVCAAGAVALLPFAKAEVRTVPAGLEAAGSSGSGDGCAASPCLNGAFCVPGFNNTYSCDCMPGWRGSHCEVNIDDCEGACLNGGNCTDRVDDFSCECRFGYSGRRCEIHDYFTLQQFPAQVCGERPNRCFKLQMGSCINTGVTDVSGGVRKSWYGRLDYHDANYTIDLCWGTLRTADADPCSCRSDHDGHFESIPRFGPGGLGPSSAPGVEDSERCHKLVEVTASRLVYTQGMIDYDMNGRELKNFSCQPTGAAERQQRLSVLVLLLLAAFWATPTGASLTLSALR